MRILRLNITNKCNNECPTCTAYGSPENTLFMEFDAFKKIIDSYKEYRNQLIVVLEGGEPFLCNNLMLMLNYLYEAEQVKYIIIETNGDALYSNAHITPITEELMLTARRYANTNTQLILSIGISSGLIKKHDNGYITNIYHLLKNAIEQTYNLTDYVRLQYDVYYTSEEDKAYIDSVIAKAFLPIPKEITNYELVEAYGRLLHTDYPKPAVRPQNEISYAVDGRCFGQDVIGRSEYEYAIQRNDCAFPIFDVINHRRMWEETENLIRGLCFECFEKKSLKKVVEEYQLFYVKNHINNFTKYMYANKCINYAYYYATRFNDPYTYKTHTPFDSVDYCAEGITADFFSLIQIMEHAKTPDLFNKYKGIAITLCQQIREMPLKYDTRTTINYHCHC